MFDFAPIGIVLLIGRLIYILLFSTKLLPEISVDDTADKIAYFIEAKVNKKSRLIDNSVKENRFRNMRELFLAEIVRDDRLTSPVTPSEVIEADDVSCCLCDCSKPWYRCHAFYHVGCLWCERQFHNPYSYQTNLMVYSAGRYQFSDYVKYGILMSVIYSIIVIAMLPIIFQFK